MENTAQPIVIAVDGGSSCGKSTLAKALAKNLGYIYIDTGAMYRAVTLYFLQNEIASDDPEAIARALQDIHIRFATVHGENHTFLNGTDVEEAIRSMEVAGRVSEIAALPPVRHFLVEQQRRIGSTNSVVMDGRDIGTVVFPHAALKVFLQANLEIRANRRFLELQQRGTTTTFEEVLANLSKRDQIDSGRAMSPLQPAEDAVMIDTTDLNIDQLLELVLGLVHKTLHPQMLSQ